MESKDILKFCMKQGLLVDGDVLALLSQVNDLGAAKIIIENIKEQTQKKVITKEVFFDKKNILKIFSDVPKENWEKIEKLKIKLGLNIEISKGISSKNTISEPIKNNLGVKVLSKSINGGKKYVVGDFVQHFRNRYNFLKKTLQDRVELKNLVSINKIASRGYGASIIGMISTRNITKNKNLIFDVEDPTGKIKVLVNKNKEAVYNLAKNLPLDGVVGFIGSGNSEIFFVNDIIIPDAKIPEKKRSPEEEYALFIADIQVGSKLFLEENFKKFIDYLNGGVPNTPEVSKIKYLFLVGDVVEGVGVFPKQEKELTITDLEAQFSKLAFWLSKIRKDITIIISPGNHDGVRLMEPQPIFDEKFAWPLFNLENVVLTGNPATVNIGKKPSFSGFNVLLYHGFSYPYYANTIPSLIEEGDGLNSPEKIMIYLLKHRHLAPTHESTQSVPTEEDGLLIDPVPDIFVSGHTHKMAAIYYNNILIISAATWEAQNKFQERMGNKPDFCKIPLLNLKTREIKILDFYNSKQINEQEKLE